MKETKFYKFKYAVIQDDGYSYDSEKIIEETNFMDNAFKKITDFKSEWQTPKMKVPVVFHRVFA